MLNFPDSPIVGQRFGPEPAPGAPLWRNVSGLWEKDTIYDVNADNVAYGRRYRSWSPAIWRESIDFRGLASVDITVPAGARIMRFSGTLAVLAGAGAGPHYMVMRLSANGTTFGTTASSYGTNGWYWVGSSGAFTRWTPTSDTFAYLAPGTDGSTSNLNGQTVRGILNLDRTSTSGVFQWRSVGTTIMQGANGHVRYAIRGWSGGQFDPLLRLQKVRIYTSTGVLWETSDGNLLHVEWLG